MLHVLASPVADNPPREPVAASSSRSAAASNLWLSISVRGIEDKAQVSEAIRDRLVARVADAGWQPSDDLEVATVRLMVEVSRAREGAAASYAIRLWTTASVAALDDAGGFACVDCSGAALLDAIEAHVVEVLPRLRAIDDGVPLVTAEPTGDAATDVAAPRDETASKAARRGPMFATGVALSAVGGVGLVGGAIGLGLAARGQSERRPARTAGASLVGVGAGMLAVGVSLLIVDSVRVRRRVALGASVTTRQVAFVVGGRF